MSLPTFKTLSTTPINPSSSAIRITISAPPYNILTHALLTDLHTYLLHLRSLAEDSVPKIAVLSSALEAVFISHLDLHAISAQYPPSDRNEAGETHHALTGVLGLLNELPTIFVAEINGLCCGGGNEIAVNCDLRFAGPGARLGVPEVVGGVVHGGGLQKMIELLGPGRALEWNINGRSASAVEAEKMGWVNRAFDTEEELRSFVDGFARRVARWPRGGLRETKTSVSEHGRGKGSMEKDFGRLKGLGGTEEAQWAIGEMIRRGEGEGGKEWELGLVESATEIWAE